MYDANRLRDFSAAVMQKVGLSGRDSALFADSLIAAELRGISSHGVTRLKTYSARIEAGLVDPKASPVITAELPSLLLIDANNAPGVPTAYDAMQLCIERAKTTGVCFAGVKNGNHFGIAQYFSDLAAQNGMIGFAVTNSPAALPPTGGKAPLLGTNPLAISVPANEHRTMCLDMATSVVAKGKVTLAKKEGRPIPEGWGIDEDGHATTDPARVACMLPFGGAKGYGISLLIEILCSCLAGASNGRTMGGFYDFSGKTQDVGFFLGALDAGGLVGKERFASRVDELLTAAKRTPRIEGCEEIFYPGEIELNKAQTASENGIRLSDAVLSELRGLGEQYNVPFDCEIG